MEKADPATKSLFISEISESQRLHTLVSHGYGNYVIQKALKNATGKEKFVLTEAIRKCLSFIQDKKIRNKWLEIIERSRNDQEFDNELSNAGAVIEK